MTELQKMGAAAKRAAAVLRTAGDTVFVRASRLPFVKPMVFSRQALKVAKI